MNRHTLLLISTILLLCLPIAKAQDVVFDTLQHPISADTISKQNTVKAEVATKAPKEKKPHNPKTATIMSACLPGLGQIYNGKWWKVPIVYAGLGGLGYMSVKNFKDFKAYQNAFKYKSDPSIQLTEHELELANKYSDSQLQTYKNKHQRDFELFTILAVAWYGLNIVDACVDGHLYSYDITDDLTFSIEPMQPVNIVPSPLMAQAGLSFKFSFDK